MKKVVAFSKQLFPFKCASSSAMMYYVFSKKMGLNGLLRGEWARRGGRLA